MKDDENRTKIVIILVSLVIVIILAAILVVMQLRPEKKEKVESKNVRVSIEYPKNEDYRYVQEENSAELSQEEGDYIIDVQIDTETLKEYKGDYENYKKIKKSTTNIEEIVVDGINGFGYYESDKDQYIISVPYKTDTIVNINIRPKVRFSGANAKEIYQRENIQEIIKNIKIRKK